MDSFHVEQETCPFCGAVGMCRCYAHYDRYIIDYRDGHVVNTSLHITRVICTCGHTHAILPDFIIPYRQYSLPFILHILRLYLSHAMTLERILDSFRISHQLISQWLRAYRNHRSLWLGITDSICVSPATFLERLLEADSFSAFLYGFYKKTLYSFLQTHANPTNCCQSPPGGIP